MELKEWTNQLIIRLKSVAAEKIGKNSSVKNEIGLKNRRRLFYFSAIAMAVDLALIILFIPGLVSASENELKWRMGVIGCHSVLFVLFGICCLISFIFLKKGETNQLTSGMISIAILVVMVGGSWLTAVDQLVTPNITPYILVCNITALVFLIRPCYAACIYLFSFGIFYYGIGIFQMNQEILISNRVNGLAAIGIGFCISVILWRANASEILDKKLIEIQKKELEQKNLELEEFAFYDQLTSLYNRRSFELLFENEVALIKRHEHEACVIIVDLDYFKKINDIYGHPFGDMILKEIAGLFIENLRQTDKPSRWGGEEFLILLPHTTLDQGKLIAEKLRDTIENTMFYFNDNEIRITASFGIVSLSADKDSSLETAYKNVDNALYLAKRKGRNRVETVLVQREGEVCLTND